MGKRPKYKHQPFESSTEQGKYTKICDDMMTSPAWQRLSLRQRGLYLYMKTKYTQKKINGQIISDDANDISIPMVEAKQIYGDLRTFRKDLDMLISHGFIKQVSCGVIARSVNIYGFSDYWKNYCSTDFEIPHNDIRKTIKFGTLKKDT